MTEESKGNPTSIDNHQHNGHQSGGNGNKPTNGQSGYVPLIGGVTDAQYIAAWNGELEAFGEEVSSLIAIIQQADAQAANDHRKLLARPKVKAARIGNLDDMVRLPEKVGESK